MNWLPNPLPGFNPDNVERVFRAERSEGTTGLPAASVRPDCWGSDSLVSKRRRIRRLLWAKVRLQLWIPSPRPTLTGLSRAQTLKGQTG